MLVGGGKGTVLFEDFQLGRYSEGRLKNKWHRSANFKIELFPTVCFVIHKELLSKVQIIIEFQIEITIKLLTSAKSFSKTFTLRFNQKGPLQANVIKLSRQLNLQLSQLLTDISQDAEVNAKLHQL